jgi:hypothetical protein
MPEPAKQLLLDVLEASDQSTLTALQWIARSYESMENWKRVGKELFFSLNGQSDVARNRLASMIRAYFVETPPSSEEVRRWNREGTQQETVRILPPRISASNSAFVDWGYVADYILLACAAISEELEVENQRRINEYRLALDSYNIRLAVHEARTIIREQPDLPDSDVLSNLQTINAKSALAHVKEARKLERIGVQYVPPKPPTESPEMPRYVPIHF